MKTNNYFLTGVAATVALALLPSLAKGQVYNSTSSVYDDETPLHLMTEAEGLATMPSATWWYQNFHPKTP